MSELVCVGPLRRLGWTDLLLLVGIAVEVAAHCPLSDSGQCPLGLPTASHPEGSVRWTCPRSHPLTVYGSEAEVKSGDLISSGRGAWHPNRPEAGVGFGVGDVTGADGKTNALVRRLVVGEVFGEDTDHAGVVFGVREG